MKIEFSVSTVRDLKRLREFIAVHNPQRAERVSLRIRQAIGKLAVFPEMDRPVEELEEVRELIAGNYVIRYSCSSDVVFILKIWHGKEYRE